MDLDPEQLMKASYKSKFLFIFLSGLLLGSIIEIAFLLFSMISVTYLVISTIGYFFLCYFFAWGNQMFPWHGAPIWIELREDGIRYQERKFWRGIIPTFVGNSSKDIPKGEPKFLPIENISFIGRGNEGRASIAYKPVKKTEYLFMKDNLQVQPELVPDLIRWYKDNAPPSQTIELWEVSSIGIDKETIRGENV